MARLDDMEVYHLGGMGDDDDHWLPFDADELPPDDAPPSESELHGEQPPEEQMDEMPIVMEEQPPPQDDDEPAKPKKGRPPKETAEEKKAKKEGAEIDRLLARQERLDMKPSRRAPPPTKASGKKSKSRNGMDEDDVKKHMELLLKVDRYRTSTRFGECLAHSRLPLLNVEHYSIEELEDLLTRIKVVTGNRHSGGGGMLQTGIVFGASVVETLPVTKRFANLDGFAATLAHDDEFGDLCEELSIDYSVMSSWSPEKRLLWCLGKNAMMVNGINKMKAGIGIAASSSAPPAQQPASMTDKEPIVNY